MIKDRLQPPQPLFCASARFLRCSKTAEELVEVSLHGLAQLNVDIILVPHGRGARGGLQVLRSGQDSTAFCGADHADTPVLYVRGGRGGLQDFRPGQDSTAFHGADHVDIPVPRGGGLQGFLPRQVSTASSSHSPGAADEACTGFFRTFTHFFKKEGHRALECDSARHVTSSTPPAREEPHFSDHGNFYHESDEKIWMKLDTGWWKLLRTDIVVDQP